MNTGIATTSITSTTIDQMIRLVSRIHIGTGTLAWCTGIRIIQTCIIDTGTPMLERVVTDESIAAGVRCHRDGAAGRSERRDDRAGKIPSER